MDLYGILFYFCLPESVWYFILFSSSGFSLLLDSLVYYLWLITSTFRIQSARTTIPASFLFVEEMKEGGSSNQ